MAKKTAPIRALGPARPRPPQAIVEQLFGITFAPADELAAWVRSVILDPSGALHNPEHQHLLDAEIGFLWASSGYASRGRRVLGATEKADLIGRSNPWANARAEQQLREWFERVPDFLVTLDALYCAEASDVEFLSLLEHELYHCGHAADEFGVPKFTKEGRPRFAIRGHDVEEFVGVVRRYGITDPGLADVIKAAAAGPEVAPIRVAQACGTCMLRAVA